MQGDFLMRKFLRQESSDWLVDIFSFFHFGTEQGEGVATSDVQQEALYEEGNFLRSAVWTLPRGDYVYPSVAKTIFSHFPLACRMYR